VVPAGPLIRLLSIVGTREPEDEYGLVGMRKVTGRLGQIFILWRFERIVQQLRDLDVLRMKLVSRDAVADFAAGRRAGSGLHVLALGC